MSVNYSESLRLYNETLENYKRDSINTQVNYLYNWYTTQPIYSENFKNIKSEVEKVKFRAIVTGAIEILCYDLIYTPGNSRNVMGFTKGKSNAATRIQEAARQKRQYRAATRIQEASRQRAPARATQDAIDSVLDFTRDYSGGGINDVHYDKFLLINALLNFVFNPQNFEKILNIIQGSQNSTALKQEIIEFIQRKLNIDKNKLNMLDAENYLLEIYKRTNPENPFGEPQPVGGKVIKTKKRKKLKKLKTKKRVIKKRKKKTKKR